MLLPYTSTASVFPDLQSTINSLLEVKSMTNLDWLSQVQEEAIEPERPICDPHHHLWERRDSSYLLHEMLADIQTGHRIVSTVFVECGAMYNVDLDYKFAPVGETEFVQGIAAMSSSGQYGDCRLAAGIVSFADLTLGNQVRPVLEAHVAASPNRFKGIRHTGGWHSSDDINNSHSNPVEHQFLQDDFQKGFSVLGGMGLSFDAWCYHTQIQDVVQLAQNHPHISIILDHFAGPIGIGPFTGKLDDVFRQWRDEIPALTGCKNVTFKLGGINMKRNGFDWHLRDRPPTSDELVDRTGLYYEFCIDQFGAERCMFESNFPVDKDSVSYGVLWNAFKKIAQNRTEKEKDLLFKETAETVYRL